MQDGGPRELGRRSPVRRRVIVAVHNNTVHWTVQWTVHKLVDSPLSTGQSTGQLPDLLSTPYESEFL